MDNASHRRRRIIRLGAGAVGVLGWLGFGGALAWALTWSLADWHDGAYHHLAQFGVVAAILGLCCWCLGTRALGLEVGSGLRAHRGELPDEPSRRTGRVLVPLAGPIVGLIIALVGVTGHGGSAPRLQPVASAPAPSYATGARPTGDVGAGEQTYTVRSGDRITALAEHFYGNSADWVAIARANMGRAEPGGERFVDPSVLRPGWTILIPRLADTVPATTEAPSTASSGDLARDASLSGALGGLGLLASALFARRLRRLRRLQRLHAATGTAVPDLAPDDAAIEVELRPLESFEMPEWVDAANRLLFTELVANREITPPAVSVVRAGATGIELLLDPPAPLATRSFLALDNGHTWRLDPTLELDEVRERAGNGSWAYLPVLVPFAEDDDGSYLVAAGAGESIGIAGTPNERERALAMVATALRQAPWAEVEPYRVGPTSFVGAEELPEITPDQLAGLDPNAPEPLWREGLLEAQPVALFQDPAIAPRLTAASRGNTVLIGALSDASRVLCYADDFVVVEPLGLRYRACLPDDEALASVARITANASAEPTVIEEDLATLPAPTVGLPQPGTLEIRLLRSVPDFVGDVAALPPAAFRFVAYLAAHGGHATMNRLRDALASYRQDESRASQTIWNAAVNARKALGTDRFPRAVNREQYELSDEVTCDWLRFEQMAKIARAAELVGEQGRAIEVLREALALVEGPPASDSDDFPWIEREQLGYAIERCVVEAAHRLVGLALAEGSLDLAEWGLEQGRRVSPDDGELRRDAMRIAFERGDDAALARERDAAEDAVDELGVGADVDAATRGTYAQLARRGMKSAAASRTAPPPRNLATPPA